MLHALPYPQVIFGDDMAGGVVKYAKGKVIGAVADNPEGLVFNCNFYCSHGSW